MKKLSEQSYSGLLFTIQHEVERIESAPIKLLTFDIHNPDDIIDYFQRNINKSYLCCKEVHRCQDDYESTVTILLYYDYSPQDKVYLAYISNFNGVDVDCEQMWKTPTKVIPIEIKPIKCFVVIVNSIT